MSFLYLNGTVVLNQQCRDFFLVMTCPKPEELVLFKRPCSFKRLHKFSACFLQEFFKVVEYLTLKFYGLVGSLFGNNNNTKGEKLWKHAPKESVSTAVLPNFHECYDNLSKPGKVLYFFYISTLKLIFHLTIRLRARDFYHVIGDEGAARSAITHGNREGIILLF